MLGSPSSWASAFGTGAQNVLGCQKRKRFASQSSAATESDSITTESLIITESGISSNLGGNAHDLHGIADHVGGAHFAFGASRHVS